MVKRGIDATTIHRTIYDTIMDKKTGKFTFRLKDKLHDDLELIVIDEISMVPDRMVEEIESFGIPIIACGDHAQLKPIGGSNNLINKPDVFLDEPVRQAEENPIYYIANEVRKGNDIDYGDYGNLKIIKSEEITREMYENADQVLMSYNKTVKNFNNFYRSEIKGIDIDTYTQPLENEKIICLKNNWNKVITENKITQYLTNGLIGTVTNKGSNRKALRSTQFNFKPSNFESEEFKRIYYDDLIFDGVINNQQDLFELRKYDNEINKVFKKRYVTSMTDFGMTVNPFDFAYGITVHKSQGSEFDNVILFDENFSKERFKSLYTAITRAKKNLIIVH